LGEKGKEPTCMLCCTREELKREWIEGLGVKKECVTHREEHEKGKELLYWVRKKRVHVLLSQVQHLVLVSLWHSLLGLATQRRLSKPTHSVGNLQSLSTRMEGWIAHYWFHSKRLLHKFVFWVHTLQAIEYFGVLLYMDFFIIQPL
jgi:hypothetical protein